MSLATLSFVRPWWLLAVLPLGMLLWRLWHAPDRHEAGWARVIDAHLLPHLLVFSAPRARRTGLAIITGGLLVAVLALAGPTLEQQRAWTEQAYRRDVTRLLVLDLSPGMTAQLEQVKLKMLALLQVLPDGQTALLVYGGEPYLVVPPTTDVETIALFVRDLATDAIPAPGNRPERALRMAGEILARSAARQREIVWITAGIDSAELPLAELAGARLLIVHAATTDNPALVAAASRTGGALVRLRADDGDIRQLVGALETGSGWTAGTRMAPSFADDLGYWLLPLLLPLAALAFRSGILALALPLLPAVLLAGLMMPQPASALNLPLAAMRADYQAWRLLEAGNPEAAAVRFADVRWRAAANYRAGHFDQAASLLAPGRDADSYYNRGNALARQGQLADALVAYDSALRLHALDADTRHNRDLVQRLLNQQSKSPKPPKDAGEGAQRQPGPGQRATGPKPPPPPPPLPTPGPAQGLGQGQSSVAERESARVAEQWLRRIPDQPGSLLRRKLLAEQRRRQAGEAAR